MRKQQRIRKVVKELEKIKCLICGKSFRQVGTHITQKHFITCRQYREMFDLEVKRGLLPQDLRELKAFQCRENGTIKNLEKGKKYRFIKKDPRAGNYKRSSITLKRVSELGKSKKKYEKDSN